jgi:hypothetical protein
MRIYASILIILFTGITYSQSSNDILNLLITNKTISQSQADSIRAEYAISQQAIVPDKRLQIDFEYRPRTEYRNGYQQLRNDTSTAAFFINQRSRLSFNYTYNNRFILQFSLQDLRVWGQQDPKSTAATLQVFEAWAEPYISDKFSIRIGRQRLIYDNQRLFAECDWRLSGAVHDALNFRYYSSKLVGELAFAFNQTAERFFGTDYSPKDFLNYKLLIVNYIKYTPTKQLAITVINSTDGFQVKADPEKLNMRYTFGGRVEVIKGIWYGTLSGYFQGGKNPLGQELSAWYIQPEVRLTSSRGLIIRLGAELFSGTSNHPASARDNSFVPLYGVAHRFNGSMDLITKFPNDVGGAGLINPYLFIIEPLFGKFEIRSDLHRFGLQKDYYIDNAKINKYLGFENDWLLSFKPNPVTRVDLGFSYMLPTKSFASVKGSGNSAYNLCWSFISLTFRPVLFNTKFK